MAILEKPEISGWPPDVSGASSPLFCRIPADSLCFLDPGIANANPRDTSNYATTADFKDYSYLIKDYWQPPSQPRFATFDGFGKTAPGGSILRRECTCSRKVLFRAVQVLPSKAAYFTQKLVRQNLSELRSLENHPRYSPGRYFSAHVHSSLKIDLSEAVLAKPSF